MSALKPRPRGCCLRLGVLPRVAHPREELLRAVGVEYVTAELEQPREGLVVNRLLEAVGDVAEALHDLEAQGATDASVLLGLGPWHGREVEHLIGPFPVGEQVV